MTASAQKAFQEASLLIHKHGLSENDIQSLPSWKELQKISHQSRRPLYSFIKITLLITFIVICGVLFILGFYPYKNLPQQETLLSIHKALSQFHLEKLNHLKLTSEECLVPLTEPVWDIFRPPVPCGFFEGVSEVKRISNMNPDEFEAQYAYSGRPVIITDGMQNWTASETFGFEYFKEVYGDDSPAFHAGNPGCQFFRYQTKFHSLRHVFQMSPERANLSDGSEPWYVGWSNCDSIAANSLREHYQRPYFLPRVSESSKTDWIFMGSPGYGAPLHIDNVRDPSWQAQIKGVKKWILEPPPECYFDGSRLEVTVHPGEIIVIDTNVWFHATVIEGDEMSITIGSEFD